MNNAHNIYNNSLIVPADPLRYAVETRGIPRVKDLYPVNKIADIERGWRPAVKSNKWRELKQLKKNMLPFTFAKFFGKDRTATPEEYLELKDEDGKDLFYKEWLDNYPRLTDSIKHHILSKARSYPTNLKWYFAQFAPEAPLDWFQFDIDIRSEEAKAKAQETVDKINASVEKLGGTVIWTTSPGDIYDGKHIQGLYAWIRLSEFCVNDRLLKNKQTIKDFFGIDCEASFDAKYRNIRLPGQQGTELVDPKTGALLHPVGQNEPQRKAFDAFCDSWAEAKPIELSEIIRNTDTDAKKTTQKQREEKADAKQEKPGEKTPALLHKSGSCTRPERHSRPRNSRTEWDDTDPPGKHWKALPVYVPELTGSDRRGRSDATKALTGDIRRHNPRKCRDNSQSIVSAGTPDAFKRMTPIAAKAVRQINGDASRIEEIVPHVAEEFRNQSIPYGYTDHTNNPSRLISLVKHCIDYFCPRYTRTINQNRTVSHNQIDNWQRYRKFLSKRKYRKELLKRVAPKDRPKTNRVIDLLLRFNGYVYCHLLYGIDGVFNSYRRWQKVKDILFPVLTEYIKPADHWDHECQKETKGKCRQYKVDEDLIKNINPPNNNNNNTTNKKVVVRHPIGKIGRSRIEPHQTGRNPLSLGFDSLVSTLSDHFSSDVYENREQAVNMI